MAESIVYRDAQYAAINCSSNGNNEIVAAVPGKTIRVLRWSAISASAVNGTWYSGAGGTALSGALPLGNGYGGSEAFFGHFETAQGAALVLNLSGGVSVQGYITYVTY